MGITNLQGEPIERKGTVTITTEEYSSLISAADHLAMCRDVFTSKHINYESDRIKMIKIILCIPEEDENE